MADGEWYYCLKHQKVEPQDGCRAEDRVGPYPTQEAAANWREDFKRRNQEWDQEDREWRGDD